LQQVLDNLNPAAGKKVPEGEARPKTAKKAAKKAAKKQLKAAEQ
jgi:hypothetical protein